MKSINIIRVGVVTAAILLIPFLLMQFSGEISWGLFDFVAAGVLLFVSGLVYELVASKGGTLAYKAAVGGAVATALLLVWINLAVGIIGSEDNPANVLYGGVLLVLAAGGLIARFKPHGMSRTLFATALAQMLVPVIALLIFRPSLSTPEEIFGVVGIFMLNGFFATLWSGSAVLFLSAKKNHSAPALQSS